MATTRKPSVPDNRQNDVVLKLRVKEVRKRNKPCTEKCLRARLGI